MRILTASTLALFLASVLFSAIGNAQVLTMPEMPETPDAVELTEDDVESFIAVSEKLQAIGLDLDSEEFGGDPNLMDKFIASKEAQDVIRSEGLDEDRLNSIGYSIAMAYAAANQSPEEVAEMQEGIAQMEQMKASMPADQWAMMESSMAGAFEMMDQFMNQPAGNVELVERYADELKVLFDDQ